MRDSFIFYKDWKTAIKDLPSDVRLEIYECITEYAFTGNIPTLKPLTKIAFNFIKTAIDRDTESYKKRIEANRENGKKGAEFGKLGGRPETPKTPKGVTETPKTPDNDNDNDNDNVNDIILSENEKKFKAFTDWIQDNATRVNQLKEPFTFDQFFKLKQKFENQFIKQLIFDMHNYKPLLTKNISAYRTFLNWAQKRKTT